MTMPDDDKAAVLWKIGQTLGKPTVRELLDKLRARTLPQDDPNVTVLVERIEKVLALPHPQPGGHPIAIAGWDACYADVLRRLSGEDV